RAHTVRPTRGTHRQPGYQYGGGSVTATSPVGVITVRVPSGASEVCNPGAWCLPRWCRVQKPVRFSELVGPSGYGRSWASSPPRPVRVGRGREGRQGIVGRGDPAGGRRLPVRLVGGVRTSGGAHEPVRMPQRLVGLAQCLTGALDRPVGRRPPPGVRWTLRLR